jgi:hypothetical protein
MPGSRDAPGFRPAWLADGIARASLARNCLAGGQPPSRKQCGGPAVLHHRAPFWRGQDEDQPRTGRRNRLAAMCASAPAAVPTGCRGSPPRSSRASPCAASDRAARDFAPSSVAEHHRHRGRVGARVVRTRLRRSSRLERHGARSDVAHSDCRGAPSADPAASGRRLMTVAPRIGSSARRRSVAAVRPPPEARSPTSPRRPIAFRPARGTTATESSPR